MIRKQKPDKRIRTYAFYFLLKDDNFVIENKLAILVSTEIIFL